MQNNLSATFLGTGTSQGVPVIACNCEVCKSQDSKDKRLRTSLMISFEGLNYVIDTGPDFRQQMLTNDVNSLEAVIFTHEHKDHTAGLDDVRAYNFKQNSDMNLYGNKNVEECLKRDFHYAFGANSYPGVPRLKYHLLEDKPFLINDLEFVPINVMHHKLPVLGYRVQDLVYITDANFISPEEKKKMMGCKVLIVNSLRIQPHISHFNLEEALELIDEIRPEKAYLVHISHLFGTHNNIQAILPKNVYCAYDGLNIEI